MAISISAVVTAPLGIDACLIPDEIADAADGQNLELIVVDGSPDYVDRSRPGLRHLGLHTADLYILISAGLRAAAKEWIVVFEDHARPLPGFLDTYRDAIRNHPNVDLFSGVLENLTSTSPWSFAFFLYGDGHYYWSRAREIPRGASTANLTIRRSAILPSELATNYGFVMLTIARLVQAGRHRHCPDAIIDHVLPLTFPQAMKNWFRIAKFSTIARRSTLPPRPPFVQAMRDCAALIYLPTVGALFTLWGLRGSPQFRAGMGLRLMMLGLANAAGVLAVDLRLVSRQRSAPAR